MNKSDEYYMKNGKLELSMLDENEEDEYSKKELFSEIEFPHSKRIRDRKEIKTKVSKEIYSTLQNMGQFLSKNEETDKTKTQKLDQIGSSLKVEDLKIPSKTPDKVFKDNSLFEKEIETLDNKVDILNRDTESLDNTLKSINQDYELNQNQIDEILINHFGRIRANYPDAKVLRAYIDEQISKIQNYGN